jgi:hypothetical protein
VKKSKFGRIDTRTIQRKKIRRHDAKNKLKYFTCNILFSSRHCFIGFDVQKG